MEFKSPLPNLICYENDSEKCINALYGFCSRYSKMHSWLILINFYRYFVSWFVPILIVFGEVGTFLCLIVLLKRRRRNMETRMWFIALSISDMYSLIVGLSILYTSRILLIFPSLFINNQSNQFDIRHQNIFYCYLLNGMVYFGLLVSTWIQVGISILRVLSLKSKTLSSDSKKIKKYAILLSVCIIICVIVTFVLIRFSITYEPLKSGSLYKMCQLLPISRPYFFYISLVIKVLLPTVLLLACSILIISHLKKFKRRFLNRRNNHVNIINSVMRKRVKQKYISFTLLGMNCTFFLLTLPFELFKIFYFNYLLKYSEPCLPLIITADKLFNILIYTNNATNWLFYFMLGQRFRQSLLDLVFRKYTLDCSFFSSTFRQVYTSLRTNRRRKSSQISMENQTLNYLRSTEPSKDSISLLPTEQKFY